MSQLLPFRRFQSRSGVVKILIPGALIFILFLFLFMRLRFQVFRPRRIQDMLFCLPFLTPHMKLHFQSWSWFNLGALCIL